MTGYYGTTSETTDIWVSWANTTTNTTTGTWGMWAAANTQATNSATTIWVDWASAAGANYPAPPRQLTAEEVAAMAELRKKQEHEAKERESKRLKAEKNALKLFVGIVGRKAYGQFKKRGYHEVIGHSGKRYRVRLERRVEEMAGNFGDQIAAFLCIHSDHQYGLPAMDTLVQQMLLVMSGEEGEKVLHRTANRTAAAA